MTTRRQVLKTAVLGAAAALGRGAFGAEKAKTPLKILILGGTGFLGPHLVERARGRGHTLTLFNRGKTHAELFPELEKLRGDRKDDLKSLKGRKWDACIDDTGYLPKHVTATAELLAPNLKHYLFVSSISVFPEDVKPGADESYPVQPLTEPDTTEVDKHYGALKAACERAAESAMPGRTTNIRPGLIVGPGDNTDRYTYWPVRLDRGGEALAPGSGNDPVQYIDVRDLAAFMIHTVEANLTGTFNCPGPERRLTMKELLVACAKASPNPAKLVWVDEKFLEKEKVSAWSDMPVWTGSESGFSQLSNSKATKAGLAFRSAEETAKDTLAWWKGLPEQRRKKLYAGIAPEREREVLAKWAAKR